jgi:cytochrome c5
MSRLAKAVPALICVLSFATAASAYDGDWKRGRVYYRGVCTACHTTQKGEPIAPNSYTKAEWAAYLQADKHAKGKETVSQYIAGSYRASIKAGNKVAEKFADAPDQELSEDVKAFVTNGAKDGDAPASCN